MEYFVMETDEGEYLVLCSRPGQPFKAASADFPTEAEAELFKQKLESGEAFTVYKA